MEDTPFLLGNNFSDKVKAINQAVNISRNRAFYGGHSSRGRGRGFYHHGYSHHGYYYPGYGTSRRGYSAGKLFTQSSHKVITNVDQTKLQCQFRKLHVQKLNCDSISSRAEAALEQKGSVQPGVQSSQSGEEVSQTDNTVNQVNTPVIIVHDVFVAGRASQHFDKWAELTSDYKMLKEVKGHRIEFNEIPVQVSEPRPMIFRAEERKFVCKEIEALLNKGVLVKVDACQGQFLSNIFLRPKKDSGKFRMILNLKELNKYIDHHHFKMDTFETALKLICKGAFMASLDLADAHYTLKIHEQDRKYLRFKFEEQIYEFTCVPNGIKSGPRLFTKLMKIPLATLRRQNNITITGYIDDTLIIADSVTECAKALADTAALLQALGFTINREKSEFLPVTKLQYLGYIIDSNLMRVTLPSDKVENIYEMVQELINDDVCTIRRAAQVAGSLISTSSANRFAALFSKQLEIEKNMALKQNYFDFDAVMSLTDDCKEQLQWWLHDLDKRHPVFLGTRMTFVILMPVMLGGVFFTPRQVKNLVLDGMSRKIYCISMLRNCWLFIMA